MELIREWFGLLRARQVVFFLDSCYSGAGGRSVSPPGFQTRAALDDRFLESLGSEGRLVVTACKANEVSLEADRLGHGVFTHFLVEGLRGAADREGGNGDGLVSMDELYDYLHRKVRHEAQSLGGLMQPMRSGSVAGTVYLTQYETGQQKQARVASAAALVAWERGEVDEAVRLWTEVVALDPGHEGARGGLAAFGELRARESAAREEEARARAAERARDERVLFELVNTQALTFEEYDRAVHLLQEAPDSLSETDRKRRRFLDARMNLSLSLSLSLSLANARSAGDGVVKAPHAARGRRAYVVRAFLERRDVHTIPQRWASSWVA